MGHNLSATSHVYNEFGCSVGFQIAGCGLSDSLSMGTSPWLLYDYNMMNLYLRYQIKKKKKYSQTLQVSYFKTYEVENTGYYPYDMEAAWVNWIHGFKLSPHYEIFLNLQGAYYINERSPFSLRRPRVWNDPTEFIISTLHEVELAYGLYLMGEVGVLGVARKYPHIHTGASLQWRTTGFLIQAGFSMTGTLDSYFSPSWRKDLAFTRDRLQDMERAGAVFEPSIAQQIADNAHTDFSIHPEMTFQFFF